MESIGTPSVIAPYSSEIWRTLTFMGKEFMAMLPLLAAGAVVFLIFWVLAIAIRRSVESIAAKRFDFPSAATAFGRLAHISLLLLGLLLAVTVAFPSMTPAKLFSALGIGGIAIGFAFKDIFQNLLAGILLLIRHPFRAGDEITSGSFTGTVESIETRATYIRTHDGQRIIVPNSVIYTEPVTVITAYDLLRSQCEVSIGYGEDIATTRKILLLTIQKIEGVLNEPAPDVLLSQLGSYAQIIQVRWWTRPKRSHLMRVQDQVLQAIVEALRDANIETPFPTQVTLSQ